MSLTLYMHPLASFCWKSLIPLYENETPFTARLVDSDEKSREAFYKISPTRKFPLLHDTARDKVILESTLINQYIDEYYPGPRPLLPKSSDAARDVLYWDRFYDFYVHIPMQNVVADRLRPADNRDPFGVDQSKAVIQRSYATLEDHFSKNEWAAGDSFTLADCAAMPALYYAMRVAPLSETHMHIAAYTKKLFARPSCARVLQEAEPYFKYFPA